MAATTKKSISTKTSNERQTILEEVSREFQIFPKNRLNKNGPDDTDLIQTVTSGSISEIEIVLKEKDAYSQDALNKSLLLAANKGQMLTLILLLKYGADINCTDENGNTSLMVCAEKDFIDMAKLLLANKADAKMINTSGNTALILSVKASGSANLVNLFVSNTDVNVKNYEGQTALAKAVISGDFNTIQILISNGANLNDVINGETIQELAAKKGILQCIRVFSDCKTSKQPLLLAALKYRDISLLETILAFNPTSIKQITSRGCTVLESFFDLIHDEKQELTPVDKSIVKFLITRGVSLKEDWSRWEREDSVMVKAVRLGDLDIVKWLYIKGSHAVYDDYYYHLSDMRFTPLMMASNCGYTEIIHFLLSQGVKIKTERGRCTALDLAVKKGHLDCAKILLEEKAKSDRFEAYQMAIKCKQLCLVEHLYEKFSYTKSIYLLVFAIESDSGEILQFLLDKGVDANELIPSYEHYRPTDEHVEYLSPLHIAALRKKPDFIKALVQSKADINIKDSNGNTALFYECAKQSPNMLSLLLELGSDVNATNKMGKTPLFKAIGNVYEDTMNVTLLLNFGASVNVCDVVGKTPMLKAIKRHNLGLVSLLIERKADTSIILDNGGTYIIELFNRFRDYYDSERLLEILNLLLKETIDINKQDEEGNTALIIACSSDDPSTAAVEILLKHGADVNLVNRQNENALSLSLTNREFSIAHMLLQKKAKGYPLVMCQEGVHLFIQEEELELIPLALGNGFFPFVVKFDKSYKHLVNTNQYYSSKSYRFDLSPLSLALYERHLDLAKYLIQVRFLTKYDVSDLLKADIFQETILSTEQGNIFNNLLSLYTLSFVQISEMLGATLNREEKVNQLPLPEKIKQQLLFRSLNVPFTMAAESVDTFSDS